MTATNMCSNFGGKWDNPHPNKARAKSLPSQGARYTSHTHLQMIYLNFYVYKKWVYKLLVQDEN